MTDLTRRSPLTGITSVAASAAAAGFELREIPQVAKVRVQALRGRRAAGPTGDPRCLPQVANTAVGADPWVLWRGPDDWLGYSLTQSARELAALLLAARTEVPLLVTDVTSASVMLELTGPRVLDVLARDCGLDLEGDAVPVGGCAQTLMAHVSVLLHRPAVGSGWRLLVERSVSQHLWDWLTDTAGCAAR
jgi:sarcosine oxidase subunit gamma